jgi:hypothetical protein
MSSSKSSLAQTAIRTLPLHSLIQIISVLYFCRNLIKRNLEGMSEYKVQCDI